jgi:hypothetical protein
VSFETTSTIFAKRDPAGIPAYASACADESAYLSACSCISVTLGPTTTTVMTGMETVTVTTSTATETATTTQGFMLKASATAEPDGLYVVWPNGSHRPIFQSGSGDIFFLDSSNYLYMQIGPGLYVNQDTYSGAPSIQNGFNGLYLDTISEISPFAWSLPTCVHSSIYLTCSGTGADTRANWYYCPDVGLVLDETKPAGCNDLQLIRYYDY